MGAGLVAARSNAAFRWCQEVVPFVQHATRAFMRRLWVSNASSAAGIPILAARAHLVVRAVEDQGDMHQRGTHHISVTEEVQAANPKDA